MEDSNIIWKFLTREYPDSHQAVYLYVCGQRRSKENSVEKIQEITNMVFEPAFNEHLIKAVIIKYLELKKKQYERGEIKVTPIYR